MGGYHPHYHERRRFPWFIIPVGIVALALIAGAIWWFAPDFIGVGDTPEQAETATQNLAPTPPPEANVVPPDNMPTPTIKATEISTLTPRTPSASSQDRLERIDCPNCQWDYEPTISKVKWLSRPSINADGTLTLTAQLNEGTRLILPGSRGGGASNVVLSNDGKLYGAVVPPLGSGWNWNAGDGWWVAQKYEYRNNVLDVRAKIDRAAVTHPGLRLCLWTGGTSARILDCVGLKRP